MKIHIAKNGQQLGPFDEEQLAEQISQGNVSYDDLAWTEGMSEWLPLQQIASGPPSTPPPVPRSSPANIRSTENTDEAKASRPDKAYCECPNCGNEVAASARLCPVCQFAIQDYALNLKEGKYSEMQRGIWRVEDALVTLYSSKKTQNQGCAPIIFSVMAIVVLVVPIVGWIASPLLFFMAIVQMVSPVRGAILLGRIFDAEDYHRNRQQAEQWTSNVFVDIRCPRCNEIAHGSIWWSNTSGSSHCDNCGADLLRYDRFLFCLPHPEAITRDGVLKMFGIDPNSPPAFEPQTIKSEPIVQAGCIVGIVILLIYFCYLYFHYT